MTTHLDAAREFMKHIVELDWAKDGEAEQQLVALILAAERWGMEQSSRILDAEIEDGRAKSRVAESSLERTMYGAIISVLEKAASAIRAAKDGMK